MRPDSCWNRRLLRARSPRTEFPTTRVSSCYGLREKRTHAAEFFVTIVNELLRVHATQASQRVAKCVAQRLGGFVRIGVGACSGFGHDAVDNAQFQKIGCGHFERGCGARCEAGITIDDGGAALRRNEAIDRVLHHVNPIAHSESQSAAAAAFANYDDNYGNAQARHFPQVLRYGFGLAALLGILAVIRTGSIEQGNNRPVKLGGHFHQPHRFAIAFRPGHAEVAEQSLLGVTALLLADHHHRTFFKPASARDDGMIVGETAVAVQLFEIGKQTLDIVERVRALGVTREKHALPTRIGFDGGFGFSHGLFQPRCLWCTHPFAKISSASGPQIRASSAQNSRSGRTLAGTSRITEKSRLFSRRSRTSVLPGLLTNNCCSAVALSESLLPFIGTRIEISDGRFTRAFSSGTISWIEIFGGAFSSGNTRPRTSMALSSTSTESRRSYCVEKTMR